MAIDLSGLSATTTKATALSNLVLVSPQKTVGYQPQNKPNADGTPSTQQTPPAFIFDYEGEQSVQIESDITDHFIEDNTALEDQIALKPEIVNTEGFIGELNNVPPFALGILKTAAEKLTVIGAYAPQLSLTAQIAYTEAFFLYQTAANAINAATAAWSSINGTGGESVIGSNGLTAQDNQTKQQVAFQQFYSYWRERRLFTVQTPWAIFQNMAIKSLIPTQDDTTRMVTSFKLVFKMIRTAATVTSNGQDISYGGQLKSQAAPLTDLGTSTPVDSIPLSSGLATMGVA